MSFTDKLDELMAEKGINKSVLSKEAGIPYTTIAGFYTKGTDNVKLSTLKKLSSYLGCSIDYLADDSSNERTNLVSDFNNNEKSNIKDLIVPWTVLGKPDDVPKTLNEIYLQLSSTNQQRVLTYSKSLLSTQKMEEDVLAAHARTDVEQTQEGVQHDLDIMNSDSEWEE